MGMCLHPVSKAALDLGMPFVKPYCWFEDTCKGFQEKERKQCITCAEWAPDPQPASEKGECGHPKGLGRCHALDACVYWRKAEVLEDANERSRESVENADDQAPGREVSAL